MPKSPADLRGEVPIFDLEKGLALLSANDPRFVEPRLTGDVAGDACDDGEVGDLREDGDIGVSRFARKSPRPSWRMANARLIVSRFTWRLSKPAPPLSR
jgi:hypothetical protein